MSGIKNIAVLGLGLIGGSIAKAIKNAGGNFTIAAYDREETISKALSEKVIDRRLHSYNDAKEYDLIFLCLPVKMSLEILQALGDELSENQIITDVCGVKSIFHKAWNSKSRKAQFIGGHPMTGKEKSGFENSDPLLFENSIYILTKDEKDEITNHDLVSIIQSMGAKIVFLSPELHDEITASVSHLPQLLSVALTNTTSKNRDSIKFTDFAAGGFRDMTRIASSRYDIWESIIKLNSDKIIESIELFTAEIEKMKKMIMNIDHKELADLFERARFSRDEIPSNTKGFISPLHDIFVFVKDVPGIISKISTALFEQSINIKDIELLKIREGDGGVFRLSFESPDDAEEAEKIIKDIGFATK